MVAGVEKQVLDIEKQAGPRLATDQVKEIRIRQFRIRPIEQVRDILKQKGKRNA